jgi:ferrochelatase
MRAAAARCGLLVMAYGTPRSPGDVEAYYTHIRRGRPPTPEQLADLRRRYDAIGGISPLAQRTEAQRAALDRSLDERQPGRWTVALGQKHAAPFIEDGVAALVEAGATHIVGLVLAPHYSRGSVAEYHARGTAAGADAGCSYTGIDSWHLEPAYLDFLAGAVAEARTALPARHKVLFTAHSLPERVLVDDPYPGQLRESAEAVAERVGLLRWPDWALAWQSAGRTPEPWRGPDILDVLRDLGGTGRSEGVLVCPQGFTSDHLEVLYDLDVEAARLAGEQGLAFARTRSLNDDPTVMAALAERVLAAAAAATESVA